MRHLVANRDVNNSDDQTVSFFASNNSLFLEEELPTLIGFGKFPGSFVNDSYFTELATLLTLKLKPHLICKRAPVVETLLQPEQQKTRRHQRAEKTPANLPKRCCKYSLFQKQNTLKCGREKEETFF